MGDRIKRIKNIRLHREGTNTLLYVGIGLVAVGALLWHVGGNSFFFKAFACLAIAAYLVLVNFFRCPIRYYPGETENIVVAPADGRVVVIEEVVEDEYFHDKRLMISIFMLVAVIVCAKLQKICRNGKKERDGKPSSRLPVSTGNR